LSGNDLPVGLAFVLGLYVLPELSDNFQDNIIINDHSLELVKLSNNRAPRGPSATAEPFCLFYTIISKLIHYTYTCIQNCWRKLPSWWVKFLCSLC